MTTRLTNSTSPLARTGLLIGGLALLTAPLLSGCFNGFGATTTMQASMNSGDGTQAQVGDIRIENATVVRGPEGSKTGTLIVTLVNTGATPDRLIGATIGGKAAYITPNTGELILNRSVNYGYDGASWINSYELDAPQSSYVPVQLAFENAGTVALSALTVAPEGIYQGITPNPATAPAPAPAA